MKTDPQRTPRQIVADSAAWSGVSVHALLSKSRNKWIVRARRLATTNLYAAGLSLADIGYYLRRHHSSIYYLLYPEVAQRKNEAQKLREATK